MGSVVSRWKAKPSTVEVLEGIDKDIQILEEYGDKYQRQLKTWVGRLILHSVLLYIIACVVVYLWYLPEQPMGRVIIALPFAIFPFLVWFLRKMLIVLFSRRTKNNNEKLEELKAQKRKILEEVMETETYKNAKMILERFDPDSKKNAFESSPAGPQMSPKPGQELRQRNTVPRTPTAAVNPASSASARPPLPAGATYSGRPPHSAPGGPPERGLSAVAAQQSLMRRPVTPGTPVPGVGMHPPGPPLARPVLPRERGAMDRFMEYLVGDGPQNRYALICQQCLSHNGMALKEEFEYVAFRCAYCYFLNPARKTRPLAPKLAEISGDRKMPSEAPLPSSGLDVEDDNQPVVGISKLPESDTHIEENSQEPESPTEEGSPESTEEGTPVSPDPPECPSDVSDEHNVSAMEVE